MAPVIPSPANLPTFEDQISVDPIPNPDPNNANANANTKEQHFLSRRNPGRMGQVAPIAYGGNTIALAVHAAHQTLPPNPAKPYHMYSLLGAFHGGTKVDQKLHLTVQPTRDTRTFATRRVIASNSLPNGTLRTCAEFAIDFHAEEPTFVKWDAKPDLPEVLAAGPLHPTRTRTSTEILESFLSEGHVTEKTAKVFLSMFREADYHLEMRHAYPSVSGANLMGLAPRLPTPQDDLPIPKRTTYEWSRARPKYTPSTSPFNSSNNVNAEALNMTALSFIMDQALSFLPLNHDHKGFDDSSACSTLDFALRVFVPDVRIEEWHLRERKTISAGVGRTYSESRLWRENGELVCIMTQTCILRGAVKEDGVRSKM